MPVGARVRVSSIFFQSTFSTFESRKSQCRPELKNRINKVDCSCDRQPNSAPKKQIAQPMLYHLTTIHRMQCACTNNRCGRTAKFFSMP